MGARRFGLLWRLCNMEDSTDLSGIGSRSDWHVDMSVGSEKPFGKPTLETMYSDHASDCLRIAYLMTGDVVTAQDLVQDAFVRLFGRLSRIKRSEAVEAYLRTTIINLSRDHFRRIKRQRDLLQRAGVATAQRDATVPDLEGKEQLLQALQALPSRQRAAVVLRYCEGFTAQETAQSLDVSVAAVKSLTNRALAKLRAYMGVEEDV